MMLPMTNVRVLDFTWAMAGPQGTRLLADFGAEVIRIESATRPDLSRTTFGPHPHGLTAYGLDSSGYFNHFNRNKRSIALNMQRPEATAVFTDLLRVADVVVENFSAGVLTKWGWSFERMRAVRPDIIYVSMAGPGHRGPYGSYRTFGPTVQALSGLTHLSGFPEMEPAAWGFSYMDHTGGYMAAIAMLIALYQRQETGRGEHVDLSQIESAITLTGPAILDAQVNGRASARTGNRSAHPAVAPHGVYRCADEGDRDRWLAIACYTEDQWEALTEAMGSPAWCADERFAALTARLTHQGELDANIEAWTRPRGAHEVMRCLQEVGVPAGVVQHHQDLAERDPQLAHRGIFPRVRHPKLGEYQTDGVPIKASRTPWSIRSGAPLWDEFTDEALGGVLGYDPERVAELRAEGVLA